MLSLKMIKESRGRNRKKLPPSSDRFSGDLMVRAMKIAQVMELIHLQEDLERDGFPSGVVPLDVAFWCFEHILDRFVVQRLSNPKPHVRHEVSDMSGHQSNVLKVWYDLLHGPTCLI